MFLRRMLEPIHKVSPSLISLMYTRRAKTEVTPGQQYNSHITLERTAKVPTATCHNKQSSCRKTTGANRIDSFLKKSGSSVDSTKTKVEVK